MRIILDFDGVICDSAFEAFRVASCSVGNIPSIFDDRYDFRYLDFLKKRPIVGPAWNYFFVLQELDGSESKPWEKNSDATAFETKFFETRRAGRDENSAEWLRLHRFYEDIVHNLRRLDEPFDILTNKNSDAVIKLTEQEKLNARTVYSMAEMPNYYRKADFIYEIAKSEPVKFLDDHVKTVTEVNNMAFSYKNRVDANVANWGYVGTDSCDFGINRGEFWEWLMKT